MLVLDGVPELWLERKYVREWQQLLQLQWIKIGAATPILIHTAVQVRWIAIVSDYFFENPELLRIIHPRVYNLLQRIFVRI